MAVQAVHLQRKLAELAPFGAGGRVVVLAEVGSTMDVARVEAEAGAPEGTVVIAERQRAGRGRLGRSWASPPGGVWMSLVLRPQVELHQAGTLPVLISVAAAWSLRKRHGLPIGVKWPNDLLLYGKKLGGILVELAARGKRLEWLIAGVGLNVNNPLPEGACVPPLSLREALDRPVDLEETIWAVLAGIARHYAEFQREGFEPIRRRWSELSTLRERVWVERKGERFEAKVRGISASGGLLVERAGRVEELTGGEVTLAGGPPLRG